MEAVSLPPRTSESPEIGPELSPEITDAYLRRAMTRSIRLVLILTAVLAGLLWATVGWRSALLLVVGAAISVASLWEWQKLLTVILAKLDNQQQVGSARVIVGFFVRLLVAGVFFYASLKSLHGSVYALLGGLVLAMFALSVEAIRLIRS